MKGITTLLFSLFLLFGFTSYLPSATAFDVLDTDGKLLRNGGSYYVVPVKRGSGGGIELAATGNETCPLTVVQSPNKASKGNPCLVLSSILFAYITPNFPFQINFASVPTCAPTLLWTVVDGLPEGPAVKIGGYRDARSGAFQVQKASHRGCNHYKLLFCLDDTCEDIGVYVDSEGNRRLVLTKNDPLLIQFQRVTSSTA
ncbi:kunitz-type trypsin inhibitor KTI1 [Cajanus cajan]|uniref:Kunitz-type trypsin inhibitor KTI1 n=1 Tax=Cajanus cajan TaxID=3821 RepID=A0A151SYZ4_CAJCA|nr:kunitz-type trypsin inhibitor KTI1 [Cajanus cajan]KYP60026.1 Kunitz-type trypsin inhibitor KTI1 [Cajanus cajan]